MSFLLKIRPSRVDADGHWRYSVGTDDLDKNIFVCTPSGSVYIHLNFHIQFPSVRRQQGDNALVFSEKISSGTSFGRMTSHVGRSWSERITTFLCQIIKYSIGSEKNRNHEKCCCWMSVRIIYPLGHAGHNSNNFLQAGDAHIVNHSHCGA